MCPEIKKGILKLPGALDRGRNWACWLQFGLQSEGEGDTKIPVTIFVKSVAKGNATFFPKYSKDSKEKGRNYIRSYFHEVDKSMSKFLLESF